MVDAAVTFTIEKLNEFVTKQVSIRTGVKGGIEWLKDELGYLLISVRAAEAHQDKDLIHLWTASVRDVANQAVVILERFGAQQEEHAAAEQGGVLDHMRRFICICNKEANLFDIGKEIEALKEKITGIKIRRDEYNINDIIIAAPNMQQRRRTLLRAASFEHEEDLIGFEDVVRTLLAQIGNGDPSLGLISIHGMGGLGKSTLASKLYHSARHPSRHWSRHAIYNGIGEYLKLLGPNSDVSVLRSLAITTKSFVTPEVVKLMCTRFKYLKVLDLNSVRKSSERIPEEIGDLILLKFLRLMNGAGLGDFEPLVIPPSIGKLKKLQTLSGRGEYIFPKEICELKEARHFCFRNIEGKLNIGNDQTKLQSIFEISYTEWFQIDTISWTNLRILGIRGSGEGEEAGYNFESIANLTNLRTLFLSMSNHFSSFQPLSSCKNLKRVVLLGKIKDPQEISFLPDSVIELRLLLTHFEKDPMPTLGSLPNLTALFLEHGAYKGEKMVCSADAFPCLQFFSVVQLINLTELQVDDGGLPSLKAFKLIDCPDIERDRIPQRVKSLPPGPLPFLDSFFVY